MSFRNLACESRIGTLQESRARMLSNRSKIANTSEEFLFHVPDTRKVAPKLESMTGH